MAEQLEEEGLTARAAYSRRVRLIRLVATGLSGVVDPMANTVLHTLRAGSSEIAISLSPAVTWFEERPETSFEVRESSAHRMSLP